jgi:hypothetical protein
MNWKGYSEMQREMNHFFLRLPWTTPLSNSMMIGKMLTTLWQRGRSDVPHLLIQTGMQTFAEAKW